jgi:hypothetical protein
VKPRDLLETHLQAEAFVRIRKARLYKKLMTSLANSYARSSPLTCLRVFLPLMSKDERGRGYGSWDDSFDRGSCGGSAASGMSQGLQPGA